MAQFKKKDRKTLKFVKENLEYHVKRTDLLEDRATFNQWIIPVCFAVFGIYMAIIKWG